MKSTTDVWFASFLMTKGHRPKNFEVIRKGKGKFFFDVSEKEWKELKLECNDSLVQELKLHQHSLKDLIH